MALEQVSPLDWVVGALLALAALRGLVLGLIRELFSLAALAAAILAIRVLGGPVGEWVARQTPLGEFASQVVAGLTLAVVSIALVAGVGRGMRRGVRAAGLGLWDRLAGTLLGAAEGAVVAVALVLVLGYAVGTDHPILAKSRSQALLEQLERLARSGTASLESLADVAAPPNR